MALTEKEVERYNRQIRIFGFGKQGQTRLKKSRVLVAGLGGLGSPITFYLAAAGVGTLRLVDQDSVELSNLNRQILHWTNDIGKQKIESAKTKLTNLNPNITIETYNTTINDLNAESIVSNSQIIVDAMDNFPARYALNRVAVKKSIPFIHGSVYGMEGRQTTIIPGQTPCFECIFPEPPPQITTPVLGTTPGVIGCIQAHETIKYLIRQGELMTGRLLIYDGEYAQFQTIQVHRNTDCPACKSHENPET